MFFRSQIRYCRRTGSLDVTDDRTGLVIHELDAHLGDTTARTYNSSPLASISLSCPPRPAALRRASTCRSRGRRRQPPEVLSCIDRDCIPVRPRTRVTFTSLVGVLEASILTDRKSGKAGFAEIERGRVDELRMRCRCRIPALVSTGRKCAKLIFSASGQGLGGGTLGKGLAYQRREFGPADQPSHLGIKTTSTSVYRAWI